MASYSSVPSSPPFLISFLLLLLLLCGRHLSRRPDDSGRCPFAVDAASSSSLTRGSSLSLSLNQTIESPGQLFTFGFFSLPQGSSSFYLGIFYNPARVKTSDPVWIANRDAPLSRAAICNFTKQGNVTLRDGEGGEIIWQIGQGDALQLLNSGNLLLVNSSSPPADYIAWQSFKHPGNTWMSSMSIGPGEKLESWRNPDDPKPGPYSLIMGNNSNFVLMYDDSVPYWDSGAWNGVIFSNVPEMTANYIFNFSFDETTGFTWAVYPNEGDKYNTSKFVMQDDGRIAESTYNRDTGSWNIFWSKPNQRCDVIRYCGQNSICNNNVDPYCSCLQGFKPAASTDWVNGIFHKGCERTFLLDCVASSGAANSNSTSTSTSDVFLVVNQTSFSGWNSTFSQILANEESCRNRCLSDCSCNGFYFLQAKGGAQGNCSLFSGSLYDGTLDSTSQGSYFLRLSAQELISSPTDPQIQSTSTRNRVSLIAGIAVGVIVIIAVLCLAVIVRRRQSAAAATKTPEGGLRAFSYAELQTATKGFKEKLGSGGFGAVYRGIVGGSSGDGASKRSGGTGFRPSLPVAVKVLHRLDEGEKQFRAEVRSIGSIQHVNLIRLLGFCSEGKHHRLLVYEMADNGSLDRLLFDGGGGGVFPWDRRFQASLGAARGIAYLHESCRECIIHCDIKPENILLDASFVVKVADFGLAKLVGREFSRVLTTIRGTRGYLAPEWMAGMPITSKADVYSFGMTLLELLSGQRNIQEDDVQSYSTFFPLSAAKLIQQPQADLSALVDPRLEGNFDVDELKRMVYCAIWCIQDNEDARLSMGKVVQILEGSISVDIPPIPMALKCLLETDSFVKSSSYGFTSYGDSTASGARD